ncbi:uncharacterized protein METZ01_LOCUS299406, partial [marine metagenome]
MLNMSLSKKLTNSAFLAFVIAIFLLPFSSAGLVEVAINNSDDLLVSEDDIVFHEGKDLNLYLRLKGDLRNSGNDN